MECQSHRSWRALVHQWREPRFWLLNLERERYNATASSCPCHPGAAALMCSRMAANRGCSVIDGEFVESRSAAELSCRCWPFQRVTGCVTVVGVRAIIE